MKNKLVGFQRRFIIIMLLLFFALYTIHRDLEIHLLTNAQDEPVQGAFSRNPHNSAFPSHMTVSQCGQHFPMIIWSLMSSDVGLT